MGESKLDGVIQDRRLNAAVSWVLIVFLSVSVIDNFLDDPVWGMFSLVMLTLVLFPALRYRDVRVMVPWEVTVLATLPVLLGSLGSQVPDIATHVSVAGLALVVAVELHVFTSVRMTDVFAVVFVVIATTANAGFWAVLQWLSDIYLGTLFLGSEEALMTGFVYASAAGLVAGAVFTLYFRRFVDVRGRYGGEPVEAA